MATLCFEPTSVGLYASSHPEDTHEYVDVGHERAMLALSLLPSTSA